MLLGTANIIAAGAACSNCGLDGRTARNHKEPYVTGDAEGVAHTTAIAFAREGASLLVAGISKQASRKTVRVIEGLSG
jgi:hypothetical protein